MHILAGLVIAAALLYYWLLGHWFARILMFVVLSVVFFFVVVAAARTSNPSIGASAGLLGIPLAWPFASWPIWHQHWRAKRLMAG